MSRFPGKKLPSGWVYVPSWREVRGLVNHSPGDFRQVEFIGTGLRPSSDRLLLGYLERRVVDGVWCFCLRLKGVPESAVGTHRSELASTALAAIEGSVAECLARPPTDVIKPTELRLWFTVGAEGVVPNQARPGGSGPRTGRT